MSDLYFAITTLIVLGLILAMWLAARKFDETRWFWGLLAAGWTVGLGGNIAWGLAFPAGTELPSFSWLDLFYLGRYALVGAAFGTYLKQKLPATLPAAIGLTVLAAGLGWLAVRPIFWGASDQRWDWLAGLSMYPLLDVPLLTLAMHAWLSLERGALKRAVAWLTGGLLAYSAANWINLGVRLATPEADSLTANLFWLLSDLLTIAALMGYWMYYRTKNS
jgi:hypothetical protein